MKKFLLLLITIIILLVTYFNLSENSHKINLNENDIEKIVILRLPSPPKEKVFNRQEDFKKVLKVINSIKTEKQINEPIKGWIYMVNISGKKNYNISFLKDKVNINGKWYEVSADYINALDECFR